MGKIKEKFNQVMNNPYILLRGLVIRKPFYWLPEKLILKVLYKTEMSKKLDFNNITTFNEKLQWLKLYDRDPKYTRLVDKYEVRGFISETIGKEYLIPLLGVWDTVEEIDWDSLPNQFVLKCTHDSGGVIICKDKSKFDIQAAKEMLEELQKKNFFYAGREWPYKNVAPRIIAEKLMVDDSQISLKDYKIFCFDGEPKLIQVMSDRTEKGFDLNHYDVNWNELNIERKGIKRNPNTIEMPKKLNEMLDISEKLSNGMSFVRVDLYFINDEIYFGELTFYPSSGYMDFVNYEDDFQLGSWINLPRKSNE